MFNSIVNNWKNYAIGLLSIALVVSYFLIMHFYNNSATAKQLVEAKQILQDPSVPIIDTFTDKHGQKHAEIDASKNVIPRAALKDSSVKRDSIIQKIDNDLNLADAKHLMEVTFENMELRAVVLRLKKDSANLALLAYHDKSISFTYDPRDSTVHDFAVNLRLTQVKYGKQKLFSNFPVIDFYADDPRITFSGISHFSVAVPPPLFGLTADARAAYLFSSGRLVPSVGLNFRVSNFFIEGRNYFSTVTNSFRQSVAFGYRLNIF